MRFRVLILQGLYRLLAVCLVWLAATGVAIGQQQPTLLIGTFVERNYSTQPGLQASYSSASILGGRPRFSASYSTTRLATALGKNGLVEDRFQGSAALFIRRARTISPFVATSVGYARFDREDEELFALLDNDGAIASFLVGLEARLLPAVRANGSVGYSALASSTVYPIVATIGVHYHINHVRQ